MVMYAPHTLLVRREDQVRDGLNRTARMDSLWEEVGPCRCDDASTVLMRDANGKDFVPMYHVVTRRYDIRPGDTIKAMDGNRVRGEGVVKRALRTNYLDYMSIYV